MNTIENNDNIDFVYNNENLLSLIFNNNRQSEIDYIYTICISRQFAGRPESPEKIYFEDQITNKFYIHDPIFNPIRNLIQQDQDTLVKSLNELIQDDDVPWIKKEDTRLKKFIEFLFDNDLIKTLSTFKFNTNYNTKMDWKRSFILQINLTAWSKRQKQRTLDSIKKKWEATKIFDNKLNWYNNDTKRKIENSWSWFQKDHPELLPGTGFPKDKIDIFHIFDRLTTDTATKEIYLFKIKDHNKNQNHQNKLRSRPIKIDSANLPSIKKLLKMEATEKKISQQRLVELLFVNAIDNGFITESTMNFIKANTKQFLDGTYGKAMREYAFRGEIKFGNNSKN